MPGWFVFLAWAVLAGITISRHEPWFDEAQAWLIARDTPSLFDLLWHRTRYEGTPGLWHGILWVAIHVLHLSNAALPVIGGLFAAAGILVWLRYCPLPAAIRYVVPFSFFLMYQYTVVARSYVLFPLLLFLAAHFYASATRQTWAMAAVLCVLATVSVHGALIAFCLALSCAWQARRDWASFDEATKKRYIRSAFLFLACLALVAATVYPPSDHTGPQGNHSTPAVAWKTASEFVIQAFATRWWRMAPFLLISLYWFYLRRVLLLPFLTIWLLLVALLIAFFSSYYHSGLLVLTWLITLWISWADRPGVPQAGPAIRTVVTAAVLILLAIQIRWSALSIDYDFHQNYSGSKAAAEFIKSRGLESKKVYVFRSFAMPSLLFYFPNNFLANYPGYGSYSYWKWAPAPAGNLTMETVARDRPDAVIYCMQYREQREQVDRLIPLMEKAGYQVRRFEGAQFFASHLASPESFFVFVQAYRWAMPGGG